MTHDFLQFTQKANYCQIQGACGSAQPWSTIQKLPCLDTLPEQPIFSSLEKRIATKEGN